MALDGAYVKPGPRFLRHGKEWNVSGKPCRIGITCDFETFEDRRGFPAARYQLGERYVRAVEQAGATVVMLPFQDVGNVTAAMAGLDGLVISGGDADVPPAFYGQAERPVLGRVSMGRALFDRALWQYTLERDIPTLGVCGGMQMLNVALGGTLFQDLSERPGTQVHEQPQEKRQAHHRLDIADGSLLHKAYGVTALDVNSTHHQIVHHCGEGIWVTATAPDGVVEAIEVRDKTFAMGIQWHPEAMDSAPHWQLYTAFVRAAQKRVEEQP